MTVIDWLNDNSSAIQAASIIVLAIVTGMYVLFTRQIARASERQATHALEGMHASLMPIVVQYVGALVGGENQSGGLILYKNVGSGPALNLEWTMDTDAHVEWLDTPRRLALGVHGSTENTEGRIRFLVTRPVPTSVTLVCEYRDVFGNTLRASQELIYRPADMIAPVCFRKITSACLLCSSSRWSRLISLSVRARIIGGFSSPRPHPRAVTTDAAIQDSQQHA